VAVLAIANQPVSLTPEVPICRDMVVVGGGVLSRDYALFSCGDTRWLTG
jgi:hypothetical protein